MLDFLKERILTFILVIAGDWISLASLIKANEIRNDAITIALAVSLIPSLVISLAVKYFFNPKRGGKKFVKTAILLSVLCWAVFVFSFMHFNSINNRYGKIPFPVNESIRNPKDSIIVGGCNYTKEAQAEVDDFAARHRTLEYKILFEDFNYDVAAIWRETERDCARTGILQSFAVMLLFLICGITLTCETILSGKSDKTSPKPATKQPANRS